MSQNLPFFIAKRYQYHRRDGQRMSRPAVRVATFGIGVGLAVMLIAVAVVVGFKREVRNQIVGFGSHIQVMRYGGSTDVEQASITIDPALFYSIRSISGVKSVQHVVQKPSILKTDTDFQGVILKGVDQTYDWSFFKQNMVQGDTLVWHADEVSTDVVLSRSIADLLHLNLGDAVLAYFVQDKVRVRKLHVVGIYETSYAEYDQLYLITDARLLQQLNGWSSTQYSSLEILVDDYNRLDEVNGSVMLRVANRFDAQGDLLQTKTIRELSPLMFDWLDMLDVNAFIILVLMLLVSGFLMISGLLILILERTSDIGILKSLGASNWTIRRIFLYHSAFLIGKGMLWGNVIGLFVVAIQFFFHIIPLDPSIYYVKWVPVTLLPWHWFLLNVGSGLLAMLMMVGPSYLITRISPVKAIRFD